MVRAECLKAFWEVALDQLLIKLMTANTTLSMVPIVVDVVDGENVDVVLWTARPATLKLAIFAIVGETGNFVVQPVFS